MKPQENLTNLFNKFNNLSSDQNNNSENIISCKYYDINEIQTLLNNKRTLSLFYINPSSLSKKYWRSWIPLNLNKYQFWCYSHQWNKNSQRQNSSKQLKLINYSHQFRATESPAGGTLLHIQNHFSYKPRNYLFIYKATEVESSFIKISNPERSSLIIGYIYRHPNMDLDEFNDNYLSILLDNLSNENKCFPSWWL